MVRSHTHRTTREPGPMLKSYPTGQRWKPNLDTQLQGCHLH